MLSRVSSRALRVAFVAVLIAVSLQMLVKGVRG